MGVSTTTVFAEVLVARFEVRSLPDSDFFVAAARRTTADITGPREGLQTLSPVAEVGGGIVLDVDIFNEKISVRVPVCLRSATMRCAKVMTKGDLRFYWHA